MSGQHSSDIAVLVERTIAECSFSGEVINNYIDHPHEILCEPEGEITGFDEEDVRRSDLILHLWPKIAADFRQVADLLPDILDYFAQVIGGGVLERHGSPSVGAVSDTASPTVGAVLGADSSTTPGTTPGGAA